MPSVPLPLLSLPSSLVFKHVLEAGEEPPLAEETFNPDVSCFSRECSNQQDTV